MDIQFKINNLTLVAKCATDEYTLITSDQTHFQNWVYSMADNMIFSECDINSKNDIYFLENVTNANCPQKELNIENSQEMIWSKRGHKSKSDTLATELLLQLRDGEKYSKLFNDKTTIKQNIWVQIGTDLKNAGFTLDEDAKVAGLKCRQKYLNLCKGYNNYMAHVSTTGKEFKDKPEFFDYLHSILGAKHKTKPLILTDSLQSDPLTPTTSTDQLNFKAETASSTDTENKFEEAEDSITIVKNEILPSVTVEKENIAPQQKIRDAKRKKILKSEITGLIDVIMKNHQENIELQKEQFSKFIGCINKTNELLEEQNKQRADFLKHFMSFLQNSKKRKCSSQHSDSD